MNFNQKGNIRKVLGLIPSTMFQYVWA